MSGFDPRIRLGFAAVLVLLMAGIVVRQGTGGLLMAAEMSIPAVLIAGWVSWTAVRDLRKGGED